MQSLIDKLKTGDGAIAAMLWIGIGLVLLVIVVVFAAWLIRVLRPTLNMSGAPSRAGRVQRLAVTDAFPLDRDGRKLVIVRRDNVEHLLLIGGPNDLLVEANFMRSDRARGVKPDGTPDGVEALGDTTVLVPPSIQRPQAPAPVQPQAAALAPSMPMRPAPPPRAPAPAPVAPPVSSPVRAKVEPASEIPPASMTQPVSSPQPKPAEFDLEFEQAMRSIEAQATSPVPVSTPIPVQQSGPPPASPPRSEPMSEMARRLSEVLQKPVAPQRPAAATPQPRPTMPPAMPVAKAVTPPVMPASAAPVTAKPSTEVEMDLLEEEMARLLGRPVTPVKPGGA